MCVQNWHNETLEDTLLHFTTDPETGLSNGEVRLRLEKYGPNAYEQAKQESILHMVLKQFKDIANVVLLLAGFLSLALAIRDGHGYLEPGVIFAIITMNIALAVSQERSAEKALLALQSLNSPSCRVLRDGVQAEIDTAALVPGDVILLDTGALVPADARLLTATNLTVDESSLTGESEPVEKDLASTPEADAPLGDRLNMVFSGCLVTGGNGSALVVATGMGTQMGKIAGHLSGAQKLQTPLQRRLNRVSQAVSLIAVLSAAVMLMVGIQQGEEFWTMVLAAVSLAVAAVPETLQLIVTLSLTHGVKQMVAQNALIRKLPAVETLGNTSIICSDKTGTLTQNRMAIQRLWAQGSDQPANAGAALPAPEAWLLERLAMASNATLQVGEDGEPTLIGDATERAIIQLMHDRSMAREPLMAQYPRVAEVPFSSARKMMSSIHRHPEGGYLILTKGAFDRLPYDRTDAALHAARKAMHDRFAGDALRVIALASRRVDTLPEDGDYAALEADLHFEGMIGLIDPPRSEAAKAIATAKKAGIKTVMITGDHAATAGAIARQIGLLEEGGQVVTGRQLAAMSDQELIDSVRDISVYARVSPEDKIRIVEAWQEQGEVVSMTGDGVNDAPALKAADVGVAMGINGTEVAKSAADMVLTDDNFATIVTAVREGRNVFANIRKTIYFLLVCNLSEIVIMLGAQLMGWGMPLTPVLLLLINVLGDGIPGLYLAREQSDPRIMSRKPIGREESFFGGGLLKVIIRQTLASSVVGLIAYYLGKYVQLPGGATPSLLIGQTMAFLVVAFTSILHIFTVRSRVSLFKRTLRDNLPILYSAIAMLLLFALIVIVPPLGAIFGLAPIGLVDWGIILGLTLVPSAVAEAFKALEARRDRKLNQQRVVCHTTPEGTFCE